MREYIFAIFMVLVMFYCVGLVLGMLYFAIRSQRLFTLERE